MAYTIEYCGGIPEINKAKILTVKVGADFLQVDGGFLKNKNPELHSVAISHFNLSIIAKKISISQQFRILKC